MTLEPQDKKALSNLRMERAQRCLNDAKTNFHEGRHEAAVNRSYYAALFAVRSLLILEGIDPLSHRGSMTMLSLRFIKPGIIAKSILRRLELLLSRRTDVDYGDIETIDTEDAEDTLKDAGFIIETLDKVRAKLIDDLRL
jgi:uncharacterized protein